MGWKVSINGQEYEAGDLDELKAWYADGRLPREAYVYHPVLQRWMYATELEELKSAQATVPPSAGPVTSSQPESIWKKNVGCSGCLIILLIFVLFSIVASVFEESNRSTGSSSSTSARSSQPNRPPAEDVRVTAANLFTSRFSKSALAGWNIRGRAAGPDCSILLITFEVNMEPSMIEAMHYGQGAYSVYEGGVNHFYRERTFRGVVYKDARGTTWEYGAVSGTADGNLKICH